MNGELSHQPLPPVRSRLLRIAVVERLARNIDARFGAALDAMLERNVAVRSWWFDQDVLRRLVPRAGLMIVLGWYVAVFFQLTWLRHERFGTFDYDLGMYDQGIWQTAHGRNFMTIRGMNLFGHHANVGFLLLVPFYWVGLGGPHLLNVVNAVALVATAWPLYLLAARHLRSTWAGFWVVVIYLFHFSTQWKIQETFHAESLAAPFVVGAFYFASFGRWRRYWLCIVAAMMWKEDVALATAALGLAVGVIFGKWRIAGATIATSAVWFLVATKLIMGTFAPDGAVFDSLFGPLGSDSTEVVATALQHPSRVAVTLDCHGWWDGTLKSLDHPIEGVSCPSVERVAADDPAPRGLAALMQPLGYLGFLSPALLFVGVPQHVVNSATIADFTWDLRWHYALMPFIGVLLASVWAAVRRRRATVSWAMIAVMVLGVALTQDRGVGPWTTSYDDGYWALSDSPANDAYRRAMSSIEDDAVVSANYFFVPHLAHREQIYTFPNPWKRSNYGAGGTTVEAPDPDLVDVLLVDKARLSLSEATLFDSILASGEFDVTLHEELDTRPGSMDLYRLERRR